MAFLKRAAKTAVPRHWIILASLAFWSALTAGALWSEPLLFAAKEVKVLGLSIVHSETKGSGRPPWVSRSVSVALTVDPGEGAKLYSISWALDSAPSALRSAAESKTAPEKVFIAVPSRGPEASPRISRGLEQALALLAFFSCCGLAAELLERRRLSPEQKGPSDTVVALNAVAALVSAGALAFLPGV